MTSAALVIGIDDYIERPLKSAVQDALAFREALIELSLVPASSIHLLTSLTRPEAAGEADLKSMIAAIHHFYQDGSTVDRFYFYFAGHGVLAYSNSARTRTRTALIPADVSDLQRDGKLLIDFDEMLEIFSQAGPLEQFYFIDACRDMPYPKQPSVGELGISGVDPGLTRRQAALFAVSPLGQAVATRGGMGHFTMYLLEALRGEGTALDFESEADKYVITMRSVYSHVLDRVSQELASEPLVTQYVNLPNLRENGPGTSPLKQFDEVPLAPLTVHIQPDSAAAQTAVQFVLRRYPLEPRYCYPLNANHSTVHLQPQRYKATAISTAGTPDPSDSIIDVRRTHQHTVFIRSGQPEALTPENRENQLVPPRVDATMPQMSDPSLLANGVAQAGAAEAQITATLRALEPPYLQWSHFEQLTQVVAPGPYTVDFRVGKEVFSQADVYVQAGSVVEIKPLAALSPLLREAMTLAEVPPVVQLSRAMGAIQAEVLPTLLAMIGAKAFDKEMAVFNQLDDIIPAEDFEAIGSQALAVVIALDGNRWSPAVSELAEKLDCDVLMRYGLSEGVRLRRPVWATFRGGRVGTGGGLHRIRYGVLATPQEPYSVRIRVGDYGTLDVVSASVAGRITVVCVTVLPDGRLDVSHYLLPSVQPEEDPRLFSRRLRTLVVAQRLYRGGMLIEAAIAEQPKREIARVILDVLSRRVFDPLLGCMCLFAIQEKLSRQEPETDFANFAGLHSGATALLEHFHEFPDAAIAAATCLFEYRDDILAPLLEANIVPVLAKSAYVLADFAMEKTRDDAYILDVVRRMTPGHPWCQMFDPGPEQTRSAGLAAPPSAHPAAAVAGFGAAFAGA